VFLVSEYMENGTLTDFLLKFQEDPIGYVRISRVALCEGLDQRSRSQIRHVVDGLHFIHTLEMVHGDLKGVSHSFQTVFVVI
jgi:serine/threonine protein kinase